MVAGMARWRGVMVSGQPSGGRQDPSLKDKSKFLEIFSSTPRNQASRMASLTKREKIIPSGKEVLTC
jgi:hypothetical protein